MTDRKVETHEREDPTQVLGAVELHPSQIENIEQDLEMTDADLKEPHVLQAAAVIDIDEAKMLLKKTLDEHRLDPYFPAHLLKNIEKALRDTEDDKQSEKEFDDIQRLVDEIKLEAATLLENSPYPEVRAVVDNTDDPSLPINTFRAWFIGLLFTIVGNGVNQLFSIRLPSIYVDTVVVQLVAFPCGKFLETVLPRRKFRFFGYEWSLNPGPFNHKEHMLITIMANVSFTPGGIYVTSIFINQRLSMFLNQQWASNKGYQYLLALSTQLMGYGLAGMTRRFLVYPAHCIWPSALATIALNKSFHSMENPLANGWKISRLKFFLIAFGGMGLYFFLPDYLFQALSTFNWINWISPNNVKLALIAGTVTGLGFNPIPTFDWNVITGLNPVLISPFFSTANTLMAMLITGIFFIPAVYFTNTWYTAHLPINSNRVFDNTGHLYNASRILSSHGLFNETGYQAYSPMYMSAANAILYGTFFSVYPATLVYAYLYHRREIKNAFLALVRRSNNKELNNDVHNRLMQSYKEVSEIWYFGLMLLSVIFGIVCVKHYPTQTPVWAIFFALGLGLVFIVPCGIIYAVSNVQITLNVLAELVGGFAIPGNPLSLDIIKTYGYIVTARAISFAQDLKLGHYVKIPPRTMFISQTIATVVGACVSLGVMNWQIENVADICTRHQPQKFTCPGANTFFTASAFWGILGPAKVYGPRGLYHILMWGFFIGGFIPIPFYFLTQKYPNSWAKYVHVPILLYGMASWAPYNLSFIWPGAVVAFIFQVYIRKRYLAWWSKYNYVLSTAFTCGVAVAGIIIFFAFQYHGIEVNWWGNNVSNAGADGEGTPLLPIPDKGYFGPGPGEFE